MVHSSQLATQEGIQEMSFRVRQPSSAIADEKPPLVAERQDINGTDIFLAKLPFLAFPEQDAQEVYS